MPVTDLYATSSCSPPTDSTATAADCETYFYFRIRTARPNSRLGRWLYSQQTFSTLEAAEQHAHRAAESLASERECRTELEVLGVCDFLEDHP